ncbi:unnamed protein product [Tenebrio molitor]|nr:unnamed protein product [Tenebrio molitor]
MKWKMKSPSTHPLLSSIYPTCSLHCVKISFPVHGCDLSAINLKDKLSGTSKSPIIPTYRTKKYAV